MASISQYVSSPANLQKISTEIFFRAKQLYGIELDEKFKGTMMNTVNNTLRQFGQKTVKMNDNQHLENLNKIIVDDCLKMVAQYRNTMGANRNPFAEYGHDNVKIDSDNLALMVDNIRAARGYSVPSAEVPKTPRIEFTEPMQD